MNELLEIFDLPFEVQGIAIFLKSRIVIAEYNSYKDVDFSGEVSCYIRRELTSISSDEGILECGVKDYYDTTLFHIVVVDRNNKYTIESLESVIKSQLNTNIDITRKLVYRDFDKIKEDEQLTELEDGQLFKISFEYKYEDINSCENLVCNC